VARSCARRWYIFLPLLLVTAWFSHSAYSSAKPVYYSQAVVGLAPPSSRVENVPQGEPVSRNALLDIGGASLVANMAAMKLKEITLRYLFMSELFLMMETVEMAITYLLTIRSIRCQPPACAKLVPPAVASGPCRAISVNAKALIANLITPRLNERPTRYRRWY